MRAEVWLTPQAEEQGLEVDAWWRENRPLAPGLFRQEVDGAIDLLEHSPEAGRRYPLDEVPGLRRLLLPKTRYHLYYVFDDPSARVLVLSFWSAVRGRGPDLTLSD